MRKQRDYWAKLVIHEADEMTPGDVKTLQRWLRDQANSLKEHGLNLENRYTAKYLR